MPKAVAPIRAKSLSGAAEYAYAATVPAQAHLFFLVGSCPLNSDGTSHGEGDFAAQAAKCIDNMKIAFGEAGATLEDAIATRVLVASSHEAGLIAAWEVVRDAFGDHAVPSTLIGVAALGYDHQVVEVEATAAAIN